MLRALLFDLDGTLRHNDPSGVQAFHQMAEEMGVVASLEQRRQAERWLHEYWAQSAELQEDLHKADGREGAFWIQHARRHLTHLGVEENRLEELARTITQRMRREYQPVNRVPEAALGALEQLRTDGFKLGLVSNREERLAPTAADLGLANYFDLMLAAGEVNLWKPDPRLLLHAVSRISVSPDEAAYIGDNYYADVVCARGAGLVPILLDPDELYPVPDCAVIRSIEELPMLVRKMTASS